MIKEQTISKFFTINNLNNKKYEVILQKAKDINLFKNQVSEKIHKDLINHLEMTKFDFIKKYSTGETENLNGKDKEWAVTEVFTTYQSAFAKINEKITFKIQKSIDIQFYKKNTLNNQKGDLKSFEIKLKSTELTKTLSFLAKYSDKNIVENLTKKIIVITDENIKSFYQKTLYYINKFGSERLLNLAFARKERLIKSIKQNNFVSLSYRSQSRITADIVKNNKNKKSKINGFINLGGYQNYKKSLSIPVKLSNKYQGNKKDFSKVYTIHFENERIKRIILTKDEKREIPQGNNNYLGVDLNIKHNLFSTSDNFSIDYNRKLLSGYVTFLKKIDNRKSKKLSIKRRKKYDYWLLKIQNHIIEKAVELIKQAKSKGFNHLVLEDLELISKLTTDNEEFGVNNGRLLKLLNLSSLKDKIRVLAHKYKITVSFVNPEFTSQCCSKCGFIDKNNRKTQETFKCLNCNNELNADFNSSINIKNRVLTDVLRTKLLSFNGIEWNCKSGLKHSTVKNILTKYFDG